MPAELYHLDGDLSTLCIRYSGAVTLDDYRMMVDSTAAEMDAVALPCDLVVDLSAAEFKDVGVGVSARYGDLNKSAHLRWVVVVGASMFLRWLVEVGARFAPGTNGRLSFAKTLDDARAQLAEKRAAAHPAAESDSAG